MTYLELILLLINRLLHGRMLRLQHFDIRLAKGSQYTPLALLTPTLAPGTCWFCFIAWLLLQHGPSGIKPVAYIHFRRRRLQFRHPVRVRFLGSAEFIMAGVKAFFVDSARQREMQKQHQKEKQKNRIG